MLASLVCFAVLTPFWSFTICFFGCLCGGTCLPVDWRFLCTFFLRFWVFFSKTLVLFFLLFFSCCGFDLLFCCFFVFFVLLLFTFSYLGMRITMDQSCAFFLGCFCFFLGVLCDKFRCCKCAFLHVCSLNLALLAWLICFLFPPCLFCLCLFVLYRPPNVPYVTGFVFDDHPCPTTTNHVFSQFHCTDVCVATT